MKKALLTLILSVPLSFFAESGGAATYLEKLGAFNVLGDTSETTVELEVKSVKGDLQKVSFVMVDDTYQQLTRFKAKNWDPNQTTKLDVSDMELTLFHDLKPTSYQELNLRPQNQSQDLWLDPNVFSFDVQVVKSAGSKDEVLANVIVKVKDEVVASGLIRERTFLKMDKKPFVDGNQTLESVLITANQMRSDLRFFEMDFEMNRSEVNRTLEKQRFRVNIDLNKISLTSRLLDINPIEIEDKVEVEPENAL